MSLNPELFEPYDRLITVTVNGVDRDVPENNTILRCLQYISVETISYGDFCWNGDCHNCRVRVTADGRTKDAIACVVKAEEGMSIETVSDEIVLDDGAPSGP